MNLEERLIYYKKLIYVYTPDWIKSRIQKKRGSHNKTIEYYRKIAKENKITKEIIGGKLNSFTIDSDVLMHSSEMNIGKILMKKEDLANALINKVDISKNTFLIASLSFTGSMYDFVVKNKKRFYDVKTSPITMGLLNEKIAELPGAIRSLHPTHSAVALGPKAIYYTRDHEKDETPFGKNSPWWKIIENDGKILLFGAPRNITSIHAVEDAIGDVYPWKVYLKKKYAFDVVDEEGKHHKVLTTCHNPATSIRRTHMSDFIQELKNNGYWISYPIGASEIVLLSARGMALTYLNWVEKGYSIYGRHRVSQKLINRIEGIKAELN